MVGSVTQGDCGCMSVILELGIMTSQKKISGGEGRDYIVALELQSLQKLQEPFGWTDRHPPIETHFLGVRGGGLTHTTRGESGALEDVKEAGGSVEDLWRAKETEDSTKCAGRLKMSSPPAGLRRHFEGGRKVPTEIVFYTKSH